MNTENSNFDLVVIGAGSGGVRAARIAASHGAKVAVVEESRPGGTCVIRGCVPKKLLVYGASFAEEFADAAGFGWQVAAAHHDWSALIAAKDKEIDRLEGIYRKLLANAGAELIAGRGRLTGPNEVQVGARHLQAKHILLATGGWPSLPDIPGLAQHAITSNEALDLPNRPEEIVIYGSGYIALEFAGIFNALGSRTHLVYRADLPLRGFDGDVRQHIADCLAERGINLHPGRTIDEVRQNGGKRELRLDDGSVIRCDEVMAATGRRPNTADLGLEAVGIEMDAAGAVKVSADSQTNIASVWCIGDATNRINLTPVAIAEGHALADSLFGGKPRQADHQFVPSAVFSQPPIASVGFGEQEAAENHADLTIFESRFRAMRNTLSGRAEQTFMKLVVESKTDRVLGVHMVGPDAAEILQGMAIAVKMGATKADFDATIGIHPSAAEEFVTMRTPRGKG